MSGLMISWIFSKFARSTVTSSHTVESSSGEVLARTTVADPWVASSTCSGLVASWNSEVIHLPSVHLAKASKTKFRVLRCPIDISDDSSREALADLPACGSFEKWKLAPLVYTTCDQQEAGRKSQKESSRTLGNMGRDRVVVRAQHHRSVKALGRCEYILERSRKTSCIVSVI
jgi:hypothetical protein